jgi:hypothetical protein
MPVIDPKGLFEGQRLAACSDRAQSFWPRLYCAANGYARLELHPPTIIGRCFHYYKVVPTEEEILAVIRELVDNFLVIPYQAEGQWWLQFATEEKFLRRRKTAEDERSPAPPAESLKAFESGYAQWKDKQATRNHGDTNISKMFPKYFRNVSATFPPGVGVGVGNGAGSGKSSPARLEAKNRVPGLSTSVDADHSFSENAFLITVPEAWGPYRYLSFWNDNCPAARVKRLYKPWLELIDERQKRSGLTPAKFLAEIEERNRDGHRFIPDDFMSCIHSAARRQQ